MLIVSQDKKLVVNLSVVGELWISPYNVIWAAESVSDKKGQMAVYESESKAKSVLFQLWSAYSNGEKVFIMP